MSQTNFLLVLNYAGGPSYTSVYKDGGYVIGPPPEFGPSQPLSPEGSDLWVADGPAELKPYGATAYERDTPVNFTESSTFITPTVEIVTLTYRLSR
jgi:hypothetical protein